MTKLEQFRSVCYTKDRKKREIPEEQGGGSCMEKKIITISREYGSGGRQIGLVAAKKLGMEFYDKELIDAAAKEIGFPAEISRWELCMDFPIRRSRSSVNCH